MKVPSRNIFNTLAFKIDGLLVLVLGLALAIIGFAFTSNLLTISEAQSKTNLDTESTIIYTAIEDLMLPGEAPIAVRFFDKLKLDSDKYKIGLFRRDGVRAFIDNSTREKVNTNLNTDKFSAKVLPLNPIITAPERPYFDTALSIPPEEVYFNLSENGRVFTRIYKPLLNLPKCTTCHGSDHTIRGVIDVQIDITNIVDTQRNSIVAASVAMPVMLVLLALVIGQMLRKLVVRPVNEIGKLCEQVSKGVFSERVEIKSKDEIGSLAISFNEMVTGLHERFELTKYVSSGAIGSISKGQEPKRLQKTLLFTDIRGFTSFTEQHEPELVVELLNKILEVQSLIIKNEGGDIDKFVGDEVVAVFSGDDSALRACTAAVKIMHAVCESKEYNGLKLGAGLASGQVIQGKIGSETRADFTVIGDSVNIAARLCSKAKAGQIIVSSEIQDKLKQTEFVFAGPFNAALKGKEKEIAVYIVDWFKKGVANV